MHLSPVIKNMRTNYRDVKRYIVHKLNHDKYKYILKIKTEKCSVSQLKSMGVSVPEGADTFTMVHIGKRDDSKYSKRITTFFNNNQICARYIDSGDEFITKVYNQKTYNRGVNNLFHRVVKTFIYKNNAAPEYSELEHLEIIRNNLNGSVKYKMHRDKNTFKDSIIKASLKEHDNFLNSKLAKRDIDLDIRIGNDGIPHIESKSVSDGINLSEQDEFLPYRFIFDTSKKRLAFTHYFIKKYHLEDLGIKIKEEHMSDNDIGSFDEFEKTITYDKDACETITLAAHEVRHAYQYAQIGRLGKGYTPYCRQCRKKFGNITNPDELEQAYKFLIAGENYPASGSGKLYSENYLEKDANHAELLAMREYSKGAKALASQIGRYI